MTAALLLATAEMLFAAIRAQDLHQVEKMLDHDPSLASARDEKGASALGVALAARKGEGFVPRRENRIVDALLRRNPPLSPFEIAAVGTAQQVQAQVAGDAEYVRSRSSVGWTPLHHAAFSDNVGTAAALLDAGADVNARAKNKFDNTPLQVALLTGSRAMVELLLARGADVNAKQGEGITALHEAASIGDLQIIRRLLAAGAERGAKSSFGTPRDLALKNHHAEAAALLQPVE